MYSARRELEKKTIRKNEQKMKRNVARAWIMAQVKKGRRRGRQRKMGKNANEIKS